MGRTSGRSDLKDAILEVLQEVAQSGTIGAAAASQSTGAQWVEDILDALKPLQALSPSHASPTTVAQPQAGGNKALPMRAWRHWFARPDSR